MIKNRASINKKYEPRQKGQELGDNYFLGVHDKSFFRLPVVQKKPENKSSLKTGSQ